MRQCPHRSFGKGIAWHTAFLEGGDAGLNTGAAGEDAENRCRPVAGGAQHGARHAGRIRGRLGREHDDERGRFSGQRVQRVAVA